ncbi:hypothetical protein [Shewanella frigidimarina]|uniref:hypothetical protein n=1 Tax=Shewanella frigidimarina TaxID=56812 RepID=UPI003D7B8B06
MNSDYVVFIGGVVLTIISGFVGWVHTRLSSVETQTQETKSKQLVDDDRHLNQTQVNLNVTNIDKQLGVVVSRVDNHADYLEKIDARFDNLEQKLDILINQKILK